MRQTKTKFVMFQRYPYESVTRNDVGFFEKNMVLMESDSSIPKLWLTRVEWHFQLSILWL